MVKKSNSTKQTESPTVAVSTPVVSKKRAPKPVATQAPSADVAPVKVVKKPRSVVAKPVPVEPKVVADATAPAVAVVSTGPTVRRVVTRDTVMDDFDTLAVYIDNELVRVRESG